MLKRTLEAKLTSLAAKFPVVAVVGPRQSGKTMLVKHAFPGHEYVSLEDLDTRAYAETDPRAFLSDHPGPAILDEAQRVPGLFSYLQAKADSNKKNGRYVLTGSQNILLQEGVSQSLAGRAAYLTVLPFSLEEISGSPFEPRSLDACLFEGFYPRLHDQKIKPGDWFPNYIRTYVERDVRMIKNITDLRAFQKFIRLCAGRVGQMLNLSALGAECGITHPTAAAWLSVLEASYIVFLLQPHHVNFGKRLVKAPKLYFHDTGMACWLLGIKEASQVKAHYLRGGLFENLVISEVMKHSVHRGKEPSCFYWRDKAGLEIDCLIDDPGGPWLIEAKAGLTPAADYFDNFKMWEKAAGRKGPGNCVVYGGSQSQKRSEGALVAWKDLPQYLSAHSR